MSLINDALKKAQKQRTGEAPALTSMPTIGGERATQIAKRGKPAGFQALVVRLGIGAAVVAVLAVGGLFLFRDKPAETTVPTVSSSKPAEAAPSSATTAPAPTTFVLPIAPAKSEPPPAKAASTPAAPARTEPAKADAGAPALTPEPKIEPPRPAAKLEPRAIAFIESLRVVGIRASATDSKVLMNDRVYRAGDMVEHEMGLKLVGITSSSLTFEDERGGRYTRNF